MKKLEKLIQNLTYKISIGEQTFETWLHLLQHLRDKNYIVSYQDAETLVNQYGFDLPNAMARMLGEYPRGFVMCVTPNNELLYERATIMGLEELIEGALQCKLSFHTDLLRTGSL